MWAWLPTVHRTLHLCLPTSSPDWLRWTQKWTEHSLLHFEGWSIGVPTGCQGGKGWAGRERMPPFIGISSTLTRHYACFSQASTLPLLTPLHVWVKGLTGGCVNRKMWSFFSWAIIRDLNLNEYLHLSLCPSIFKLKDIAPEPLISQSINENRKRECFLRHSLRVWIEQGDICKP